MGVGYGVGEWGKSRREWEEWGVDQWGCEEWGRSCSEVGEEVRGGASSPQLRVRIGVHVLRGIPEFDSGKTELRGDAQRLGRKLRCAGT
jgi:hypothetical protein